MSTERVNRLVVSSACFSPSRLHFIQRCFLKHIPDAVQMEQMIFDPDTLEQALKHPSRTVAGLHYKPASYEKEKIKTMSDHLKKIITNENMKDKYLTVHGDDVYLSLKANNNDQEVGVDVWVKELKELAILAKKNNVTIAVENSANPDNTPVPPYAYRLQDMVRVLREVIDDNPNLRICFDISHLMEDDPIGFSVLAMACVNSIQNQPLNNFILNDCKDVWADLKFAISHAHTIHFSRASLGEKTYSKYIKWCYEHGVPHWITTAVHNLLGAHLTGSSDSHFFNLMKELTKLGFKGIMVAESFAVIRPRSFINDVKGLRN